MTTNPHAWLVDLGQRLKPGDVGPAGEGGLAVLQVRVAIGGPRGPVRGDRDAAHCDVAVAAGEVVEHPAPGGGYHCQRHSQLVCHIRGHVEVDAAPGAGCRIVVGERPVVASAAHPQNIPLVDPGQRRLG
ncbi:MAG TPA: hypothetical protein VE196_15480, partial [Pseudonocardiaceae bacterium]|nr:hypothetical protein [Pseudonocardiaceae bacterium]